MKAQGEKERRFDLGYALFTAVGRELLKVSNATGKEEYRKLALHKWSRNGWKEPAEGTTA